MKRERELIEAFQKLFFDEKHVLKNEAKIVLNFLREECGARGELGQNGVPYFYDAENRFDPNAAIFLLGKRRVFDVIACYLNLEETDAVFRDNF
jgi:hypothetical protein